MSPAGSVRALATLVLLPALAGCPTNAMPIPQSAFTKPYFQLFIDNTAITCVQGFVASSVNADGGPVGSGQGWQELQCNGATQGFFATQTLSAAQMTELANAFAALPAVSDPTCDGAITQSGAIVTLRAVVGSSDVTWNACVSGADGGVQLSTPYETAASLLQELVQTPQLLGPDQ